MKRQGLRVPPLVTVLALWLAGLCAAAQFAKIGLVLPELGLVYPDAGLALGFLVSSISLVGVLFGLIAGMLASRVGLRRLLLGGLMLGAIVSLVQATLPSLPLLLASRVLEGAAHLAIVVTAPTLIATTSTPRHRPGAMTLWGTFFGVSFALVAWLGLPLVEARGLGALFLVHGLVTGMTAVLLAIVLPGEPRSSLMATKNDDVPMAPVRTPVNDTNASFTPRELLRRHRRAWTSPFIAAPAAGWIFYTITFVALLAVLPGLVDPAQRAFVAAAMPLASILSSMTIGVALIRRLGAVHVVRIGFAAAIVMAMTLLIAPGETLPCIALFAALGLVQGASFAAIPELNATAADQALANGTLAQAGNLGNACGTPLLLALLGTGGPGSMVALVIACYATAIVAHTLLSARRHSLPGAC